MFNLIARRIDRIRVRATLKPHRPSTETSGVLWIRDRRFESFLASQHHTIVRSRLMDEGAGTSLQPLTVLELWP